MCQSVCVFPSCVPQINAGGETINSGGLAVNDGGVVVKSPFGDILELFINASTFDAAALTVDGTQVCSVVQHVCVTAAPSPPPLSFPPPIPPAERILSVQHDVLSVQWCEHL